MTVHKRSRTIPCPIDRTLRQFGDGTIHSSRLIMKMGNEQRIVYCKGSMKDLLPIYPEQKMFICSTTPP